MLLAGSLKPNESLTQLVAGLIVVLTFTLAASAATGGGQEGARAALLGAIAANASWGIINAVLYVMDSAFDRNRQIRVGRAIASTLDEATALAAIRYSCSRSSARVTDPIRGHDHSMIGPAEKRAIRLSRKDWHSSPSRAVLCAIRSAVSLWDPAPPAIRLLRGFSGDGARCRRSAKKGSQHGKPQD